MTPWDFGPVGAGSERRSALLDRLGGRSAAGDERPKRHAFAGTPLLAAGRQHHRLLQRQLPRSHPHPPRRSGTPLTSPTPPSDTLFDSLSLQPIIKNHFAAPLKNNIHVIPCRYSHTSLGLVRIHWSSPIYWNVSVGGAGYRKKRSATCWSTRATCWRWWPPWCSCATCRCRSRSVAPASAWLNWATPWPSSSTTPASQRRQWAPATSYKYRSFSHFHQDWFGLFRAMHSF